jgi:capsular polysaccharide transport system permease protein
LWAILNPLAMIIVFGIIHSQIGSKTSYSMPVFLAVSFVSYNLFKGIVMQSLSAFSANKGLFVYKQVKPIDTIFSRFFLEFFVQIIVAIILVVIGIYLNIKIEVKDLLFTLLSLFWFAFFGLSLGVLFAVLGYFFENFPKIINLVFLPMFFMSGLFFTAENLPSNIRDILLYNPVFQFEELIHGWFFYSLSDRYVDYDYLLMWTIIPLFLGLWLYKRTEKKIIMS